jgi:hypothetical protein
MGKLITVERVGHTLTVYHGLFTINHLIQHVKHAFIDQVDTVRKFCSINMGLLVHTPILCYIHHLDLLSYRACMSVLYEVPCWLLFSHVRIQAH